MLRGKYVVKLTETTNKSSLPVSTSAERFLSILNLPTSSFPSHSTHHLCCKQGLSGTTAVLNTEVVQYLAECESKQAQLSALQTTVAQQQAELEVSELLVQAYVLSKCTTACFTVLLTH